MFNRKFLAVLILIFAGLLAWFVYASQQPASWSFRPFRLGLDLRGGSHLVYEADVSQLESADINDSMSTLREVIERRINAFGVGEPIIQVEEVGLGAEAKHRLIVELPGVTDIKEATELIKVTPLLEFKVERPDSPEKDKILAAQQKYLDNIKASSTDPLAGLTKVEKDFLNQDPYYVSSGLTGRFLERSQVQLGGQGIGPSISLEFNQEGADLFAEITAANVDKTIAIYLDGQPLSAPVVREAIRDGRAEISGQFTVEEARDLSRNLNLGALPVPINLVQTETVGATLGDETLAKGVNAGLIGFAIVALFMILWYRLPGVVAMLALAFYIVLLLAIFKLLPVTLTAAGIAGLILSFGMALDANILIFERLKEELRAGKHLHEAIREGFSRAWLSIRDANLSSLIAAIVLFWLGTSLMKGFALTLALGIVVSMFTAISITRTLLLAIAPAHAGRVSKFLFKGGIK